MGGFYRICLMAIVAGVLGSAPAPAVSKPDAAVTVVIEDMKFSPAEIRVKKGESILWVNKDLVPHTVTAKDGSFDSNMIAPGKSWRYSPEKSGMQPYKCIYHPTMIGTVVVR
jgi:plastocyanin